MTETLPIDRIQVGPLHRSLSQETVAVLANSMKEIGLQTPITVWANGDDPLLVTGLHRLEAGKKLDWDSIPVSFVTMDETGREMWEISENLHRADLTKEERDKHIRRYAALLEERKLISSQNAVKLKTDENPKGAGRPVGTTGQIANETGLSKDTVRRALDDSPKPPKKELSQEELANKDFERIAKAWDASCLEGKELFREFLKS